MVRLKGMLREMEMECILCCLVQSDIIIMGIEDILQTIHNCISILQFTITVMFEKEFILTTRISRRRLWWWNNSWRRCWNANWIRSRSSRSRSGRWHKRSLLTMLENILIQGTLRAA
jgi:hypothetical protein